MPAITPIAHRSSHLISRPILRSFPVSTKTHILSRKFTIVRSTAQDLIYTSEILGKQIILFVGFFCGLQYFYYRELRMKIEEKEKDKKK